MEVEQYFVCPVGALAPLQDPMAWGHSWHMQSPFDNVKPGTLLVLRLYVSSDNPGDANGHEVQWGCFDLNKNVVDSGPAVIPMWDGECDMKTLGTSKLSVGGKSNGLTCTVVLAKMEEE